MKSSAFMSLWIDFLQQPSVSAVNLPGRILPIRHQAFLQRDMFLSWNTRLPHYPGLAAMCNRKSVLYSERMLCFCFLWLKERIRDLLPLKSSVMSLLQLLWPPKDVNTAWIGLTLMAATTCGHNPIFRNILFLWFSSYTLVRKTGTQWNHESQRPCVVHELEQDSKSFTAAPSGWPHGGRREVPWRASAYLESHQQFKGAQAALRCRANP